jgi:hypothetical protein
MPVLLSASASVPFVPLVVCYSTLLLCESVSWRVGTLRQGVQAIFVFSANFARIRLFGWSGVGPSASHGKLLTYAIREAVTQGTTRNLSVKGVKSARQDHFR